jgi:hypothetical protein
MRSVVLMSVMFVVAGCKDQCDWKTDPGTCSGNSTVTCDEPGVDQIVPNRWMTRPCGALTCVTAANQAFCTLDAGLSALCDGGSGDTCDGKSKVSCREGFETARADCLSCRDAGVCDGELYNGCTGNSTCASGNCRDAGSYSYCAAP